MTSISDLIRVPFGYLMQWLYTFTGNYGIALILFAVIVKLIMLPSAIKSRKSSMKMARLSPELKRIEAKYPDDKMKQNQAMQELYKKEGISMGGGCLWSLLPLLIIFPLYQVIREPLVYIMHMPKETAEAVVTALKNIGVSFGKNDFYAQLVAASVLPQYLEQVKSAVPELANQTVTAINFRFLGMDLSAIPDWHFWALEASSLGLFILPLISGASNWATMWISQRMNKSVSTNEKGEKSDMADQASSMMNSMMLVMPIMSIWIGYSMPAAISIYWIAQAVLGVVQELALTKMFRKEYDAEDELRRQRAAEEAAIEAEKERIRAERRAANPDGITDNTSKKKIKAKEKAERQLTVEGKLTPEEREELRRKREQAGIDPNRPYAKGRAYIADRYAKDGSVLAEDDAPSVLAAYEAAEAEEAEETDAPAEE